MNRFTWNLIYIFMVLTIYNIIFDWLLGNLGAKTVNFESGIILTIVIVYFFTKDYFNE